MTNIIKARRKARINVYTEDRTLPVSHQGEPLEHLHETIDLPPAYIVEVQIKTWFHWVCIWRETCDVTDADARTIINSRARKVYDTITD
jgi:hypothetical protein